jgi:3'(2'), 5'-bisphosphate nucleotidase
LFQKNVTAIGQMVELLLVDKAIEAALCAGNKIREVYSSAEFFVRQKEDETPVTLADQLAHQEIIDILKSTSIPVLSEEGTHSDFSLRKTWTKLWLVDPLDGTKEFIKRNDEFTVNIAFIINGKPMMGVIYAPVWDELYVGIIGTGAWRIKNPPVNCSFQIVLDSGVKLPDKTTSDNYVVLLSRSHMNTETELFIEKIRKENPNIQMESKGSSLKLCLIAEGSATIYPKLGKTMEWDTAAGHAILKSVGKNVFHTDQKTELTYNKENLQNPQFIAL